MLNMKIHKERMHKDIHRQHRNLDEVKRAVDALPDRLPEGVAFRAGQWAVYIDIPWDWEKYRQVRRCLRGWTAIGVYDNEVSGEKFYVFYPPGVDKYSNSKLYITLKPNMGGSKCHVEVVGKREVDIVEVICDD